MREFIRENILKKCIGQNLRIKEKKLRKNETFSLASSFISYLLVFDYYDSRHNGELSQELPDSAVVLNVGLISQ